MLTSRLHLRAKAEAGDKKILVYPKHCGQQPTYNSATASHFSGEAEKWEDPTNPKLNSACYKLRSLRF